MSSFSVQTCEQEGYTDSANVLASALLEYTADEFFVSLMRIRATFERGEYSPQLVYFPHFRTVITEIP